MTRIEELRGVPWRGLLAAGAAVLALSVGLARPAGAATRFVATTGNDSSNTCLASGSPCKTITRALTQAVTGDTISVAAGTYNLALGETFPLSISKNLTLTGAGAGSTIIDATGANTRVITVNSGVTVTISGVTITGGAASCTNSAAGFCRADGGGLENSGTLTLTNSTVSGNTASCNSGSGQCGASGGGLDNVSGTLTVMNSTMSGNTASCTTSGIGECFADGGGLENSGTLTVTASTVSGNTASCTGSGCSAGGGGLGNQFNGTLTVTASTVSGNTASSTASGTENCAAGGGLGNGGTATLTNVTVSGNTASCTASVSDFSFAEGAGLFNYGTLTVTASTVSGNTASCTGSGGCFSVGGGLTNVGSDGTLTVTASTVSGNTASCSGTGCAALGGGLENSDGTLTVMNSTVSGNTASCTTSGCGAAGGGLVNHFSGTLTGRNATVTANSATCSGAGCTAAGGGLDNATGTTTLLNTIVAKQLAGADCANSGTLTSNGFNLASDNTCQLTQPSDKPNVSNPLLGPLQNNGGPTQTHALLPGSPAIDAVTGGCPPPTTDQRGVARPQGAACDIGAYELAVSVSPGHAGDALIFPLWDVNNLDTLMAIESLTAGTQVHNVRFRDDVGNNALDFTLCLLPHSTWSAAIFRDGPLTRVVSESTLLVNGSSTPLNATLAGNPTRGYIEVIGLRSSLDPGVCGNPAIGEDVPNSALMGRAYYVNPLQNPILAYGANALALRDFASDKITDGTVLGNEGVALALLAQGALGSVSFGSRYFVDPAFGAVTQVVATFPTGPSSLTCPACQVPASLIFAPATEPGVFLTSFSRSTGGKLVTVFILTSSDIASPSGFFGTVASPSVSMPLTGFVVQTNTLSSPIFNVLFPLSIE